MKKYLILALIVISSVAHAEKRNMASQMNNLYGERNEFTTDDPCQAANVVGCGPCFKACMEQHHGDNAFKTNTSFGRQQPRRGGNAKASGQ